MQTFLTYADFTASSEVLDSRRLGKQRVETYQILRALTFPAYAWKNHPAVRMWRGFVPALVAYGLATCTAWERRGYSDTVAGSMLAFTDGRRPDPAELASRGQLPPWLGMAALHLSHRSALVRKEPEHYRPYFPEVPDDLPYLWPDPAFPRWPARGRDLGAAEALTELGLSAARDGQLAAVQAVLAGRDVLVTMRRGHGGSTTGLLAALAGPGPTLWVSPHAGPAAGELDEPPVTAPERPAAATAPTATAAAAAPELQRDETPAPVTAPELRSEEAAAPVPASELPTAEAAAADRAPRPAGSPLARPPGPEDLAAMAAEAAAEPDLMFLRPFQLAEPRVLDTVSAAKPALLVVDDCAELSEEEAAAVVAARAALGSAPILALTGPADGPVRARLTALLGLVAPVRAGGGFDRPEVFLSARVLPSEVARRSALPAAVRAAPGPGLVSAPDRVRAERLAAALARAGVRAAAVAPDMRPGRVTDVLGRYRAGRLAALVFPAAAPPQLGRARVHFLHVGGPPADLTDLHRLLGLADRVGQPARSELLLLGTEVSPALEPYVRPSGCRRAALLEPYGEPVVVPCGRCDMCSTGGRDQWP